MIYLPRVIMYSFVALTGVSSLFSKVFDDAIIQKQKVAETTYWDILVDYAPLAPGHLLAVAKSSKEIVYKRLEELPQEAFSDLYTVTEKIHRVFSECLHVDDYLILQKNGRNAGQSIDQVHIHYIPMESTKWRRMGHLKMFFKILFGSSPDDSLEKNVVQFRDFFEKTEKTAQQ